MHLLSIYTFLVLIANDFSFLVTQKKEINTRAFFPDNNTDSVVVKTYSYKSKELSNIGDSIQTDQLRLLASSALTAAEQLQLKKELQSSGSFYNQSALLSHYNISIDYYKEAKVIQCIQVSSLTGTVKIRNQRNKKTFEEQENRSLKATKSFKAYLTGLLRTKHLWSKNQGFSE